METIKVYVGTYGKYNDGNLNGAWLDLSNYVDKDDFINACLELHKDESDPELMFQDFDYPESWIKNFVSETHIDERLFDLLQDDNNPLNWDDGDYLNAHNEMCSESNMDDYIYYFDNYFFEDFFADKASVAQAVYFGNIDLNDEYIMFNGSGNLESLNNVMGVIDDTKVIEWWIEKNL